MAFRADEAASRGFEQAKNYLIPRQASPTERDQAEAFLREVVSSCGPVVGGYPSWHPFLSRQNKQHFTTLPDERCGYQGLDHTVYFAHGFITCPYSNGINVIKSAKKIDPPHGASIEAEEIDITLYNSGTQAILVRCEWSRPLESHHLIPKALAVPLMLEQEVPTWRWSECAESWETMRPYLLGTPSGNRSSLFVGQDTALAIKKIYISLVESGMFGRLKI